MSEAEVKWRRGLYGLGAELVQGFLAGVSPLGACDGR
jgi:hypothetical protein